MIRVGSPWKDHDPSETYDALVVGSGIGGLATAALLARHGGKRVLVLERHWMPGGFTHVFRRKGYEWDVGVHYIGGVESRRSPTWKLFDHVGDGSLEWAPMGEITDRILLGERQVDLAAGREAFRRGLIESFPREAGAIDSYLEALRRATGASNLYFAEKAVPAPVAAVAGPLMRRPFLRWAGRTTRAVLEDLTDNRELLGALTGQWGDYGLPPGRSSFGIHALVADHYIRGGSYPVGGSSAIAAASAPVIEKAGGRILYQAEVAQILVEGKRAVGVRMADGSELRAPLVVSDAGATNTFGRLLSAETRGLQPLRRRLDRIRPSMAHACLYLGFRRTAAELGLPKHNFWIYPGPDHDANVDAYLADESALLPLVYVSFPSAKDPTFEERYPGRATVELLTLAPWERFEAWGGSRWRDRPEAYEAAKARLAERMLEALEKQLPGLRQQIDHQELSTPLSTRHFAGYQRGEIYGLEHTPERFRQRWLAPRTPISGLYLTGQDAATCGVTGALIGGYLTASAILRRNLLRAALRA